MRHAKRIIAGLLSTTMIVTALTGCGQEPAAPETEPAQSETTADAQESQGETAAGEEETSAKTAGASEVPAWQAQMDWEKIGWQPDPEGLEWREDTSPITLDYYANFSWFSLDWTDSTAKRVTEKTGVDLNFTKPVVDDGQKLNMMIAGDQLPDIMTVDRNDAALQTMIDAGMLWSFEDLIDQYAPKMRDIIPKEILSNYQAEDGKTYQFTTWVQGEAWQKAAREYNQIIGTNQSTISVRKDYYDEIGRPEIKNMDDFIEALGQMKANHPDKMGFYPADNSMAASTFASSANLSHYGRYAGIGSDYSIDGDTVSWVVREDTFKKPMEYLNQMYLQDLLTKDPFIDTKDVAKAKIEQGDVISYAWTISDGTKVPGDNLDTQYEILPPFEDYVEIRTGTGWLATVVPKSCKNPERAIRFLEYLSSVEGHSDVSWGVEGEEYKNVEEGPNWHMVDGKPVLLEEYLVEKNADWGGVASKNGLGEYWLTCNELLWNLVWWDNSNEEMNKYNEWFGSHVQFRPELDIKSPSPDSEEGIIQQKAYSLLQQYSVEMIFTDDFEGKYQEFIDKIDEAGMDRVEAYWTEEYKDNIR